MIRKMLRFYQEVYRDNDLRVSGTRNKWKDYRLFIRNEILRIKEFRFIKKYYTEEQPLLFIVSVPRSGSTLISQLICQQLEVGYISNFVARYWSCPLVGLSRYQADNANVSLESNLGNTSGLHDPHEFGYFWQYWFNHTTTDELSEHEIRQLPWENVRNELNSLAGKWQKPLVIKSIVHTNFNIRELARQFPNARFLHITREPLFVMKSILQARVKRYGSEKIWWSIRPKEIEELKKLSIYEQVASQIILTRKGIEQQLQELSSDRWQQISYETLTEHPSKILNDLARLIGAGVRKDAGPIPTLQSKNQPPENQSRYQKMEQALADRSKVYQVDLT